MSQTQATPADPVDDGPTDCIHCHLRIRRFGRTRRWCHDETGDVQCATDHKPEDEAAVEQLLGTLAAYRGHFGPRDAANYAATLLDMAHGRRSVTPARLVECLDLCPAGEWHFTEDCDAGCAAHRRGSPWQLQFVGFFTDGEIYGDELHRWRIRLGERTEACAFQLLSERRPAWPNIIHAPNGLPLFVRETDEPCDCAAMGAVSDDPPKPSLETNRRTT